MDKMINMKTRPNYVFLVYCNSDPLLYAIYGKRQPALDYADCLIEWRFEEAKRRGFEYGFYHKIGLWESEHYRDEKSGKWKKLKESEFDEREKMIFSACLIIKDNLKGDSQYSEDKCMVQVVRRPVYKSFKKV